MNYQIAVCDDNSADIEYVSDFVKQWARNNDIMVHIDTFLSAEAFLFQYEETPIYDILLLDIEMGALDGVSLAKRLRADNEALQIIFITGYSDYISEGYEVAALHYLIKPVKQEKLFEVLHRAVQKVMRNEKILTFEISKEIVRIPIFEIRYVDVHSNYITIHAKTDVTLKMTLNHLMTMLDNRFYRVGRSSIVNLSKIRRITKSDIHLQDGALIPLPRGAYEGINRAIINME